MHNVLCFCVYIHTCVCAHNIKLCVGGGGVRACVCACVRVCVLFIICVCACVLACVHACVFVLGLFRGGWGVSC